ncbi:hypothetical protein WJ976_33230 (plasmid) [Achromobacter denitrificans]
MSVDFQTPVDAAHAASGLHWFPVPLDFSFEPLANSNDRFLRHGRRNHANALPSPAPLARMTILARDIADQMSANLIDPLLSVPTCLELVAAARNYGSYAAYTQAVKNNGEQADFARSQCWLVDAHFVAPRITTLGLDSSMDTANLVYALQLAVCDLARDPERPIYVATSPQAYFEIALESIVEPAITAALNPRSRSRGHPVPLVSTSPDLQVQYGSLALSKVGPQPSRVGGWLRASFFGTAEDWEAESDFSDDHGFIARVRLRRLGRQIYTACQAEILVFDDVLGYGYRPDLGSDPDGLASLIASSGPP